MKKKKVLSVALAAFMAASNLSVPGNFVSERRIVKAEELSGLEQLRKLQFCTTDNGRVVVKVEKSLEGIYDSLRYDIESRTYDNNRTKITFDKLSKEQLDSMGNDKKDDISPKLKDNDWEQYAVFVTKGEELSEADLISEEGDTFSVYFEGKESEKLSFTIKRADEIKGEEAKKIKQVIGRLAIQGLKPNSFYEIKQAGGSSDAKYDKIRTDENGVLTEKKASENLVAGEYDLRNAPDDWIGFESGEMNKDYLIPISVAPYKVTLEEPYSLWLSDLKNKNFIIYQVTDDDTFLIKCGVEDRKKTIGEVGYTLGNGEFTPIWSEKELMSGAEKNGVEVFEKEIPLKQGDVELKIFLRKNSQDKLTFTFKKEKVEQISVNDKTLTGFGTDKKYQIKKQGEEEAKFERINENEHQVNDYGVYEIRKNGNVLRGEILKFDDNEVTKTLTWDSEIKKIHVVDPAKKITKEKLKDLTYKVEGDILVVGNLKSLEDSLGALTYKISENSGESVKGEIDYTTSQKEQRISGIGAGKTFEINGQDNQKLVIKFEKKDRIDNTQGSIKQVKDTLTIEGISNQDNYEISTKEASDYHELNFKDNLVTVPGTGTYYLRKKAMEGNINFDSGDETTYRFASDPIEVKVEKFDIKKAALKKLKFEVKGDKLKVSGLKEIDENSKDLMYKLSVDGAGTEEKVTFPAASDTIEVDGIAENKKFEIYSSENDKLTINFDKEVAAQVGSIKQVEGKLEITGIPADYEYRKAKASAYIPVNGTTLTVSSFGEYFFRKKGSTEVKFAENQYETTYKLPSEDVKVTVDRFAIKKEDLKNLDFTVKEGKLVLGKLDLINPNSKNLKYRGTIGTNVEEKEITFPAPNKEVVLGDVAEGKTFEIFEGTSKLTVEVQKEAKIADEAAKKIKQAEGKLEIEGISATDASSYEISMKKDGVYKPVVLTENLLKVTEAGTYYLRRKSTTQDISFTDTADTFTYKLPSDVIEIEVRSIHKEPKYLPEIFAQEPKKEEPKKEENKEKVEEKAATETKREEGGKEVVEVVKSAKKNEIIVEEEKIEKVLASENGKLRVSLKNLGLTFSKEALRNFVQDIAKKFDVSMKVDSLKKSTKVKTGKKHILASRKHFKVTLKVDGKVMKEADLQGEKVKVRLSVKLKNKGEKFYVMNLKTGKKHSAKYKSGKLTFATDRLGSFVVVKKASK